MAHVEANVRHICPPTVHGELKHDSPRIRIPPKHFGAYTADINMLNLSIPSVWRFKPSEDLPCMNHFLGMHACLDRTCTYRHGNSHEKSLPRIFQWFHCLED